MINQFSISCWIGSQRDDEKTKLSALRILIFGSGGVSTGMLTELRTAPQMAEDAEAAAKLAGSYVVPE